MIVDAVAFAVPHRVRGGTRGSPASAWWWLAFLLAARAGRARAHRLDHGADRDRRGCWCWPPRPALAAVLLDDRRPGSRSGPRRSSPPPSSRCVSGCTILTAASSPPAVIVRHGAAPRRPAPTCSASSPSRPAAGCRSSRRSRRSGCGTRSRRVPAAASCTTTTAILTYQLRGPGSVIAAAIMTPLLAIVVGRAARRRRSRDPARDRGPAACCPPLALAITTALILFNKVGSPQFVTWLAVPIVFGLVASRTGRGPSFRVPSCSGW